MESPERVQIQTPISESRGVVEDLQAENTLLREQLKERDEQIEYLKKELGIDPLTGTSNRRIFDEELDHSLKLIRGEVKEHRAGVEQLSEVSLIMLDIDFFKEINDTFGHPVGDEVLRKVSALLMNSVRDTDIVARVGGEEFVIFLLGAGISFAASHAEELRTKIEQMIFDDNQELKVTTSFGVVSSKSSDDAETLYKYADSTMYKAKQGGRNRVEVYKGNEQ